MWLGYIERLLYNARTCTEYIAPTCNNAFLKSSRMHAAIVILTALTCVLSAGGSSSLLREEDMTRERLASRVEFPSLHSSLPQEPIGVHRRSLPKATVSMDNVESLPNVRAGADATPESTPVRRGYFTNKQKMELVREAVSLASFGLERRALTNTQLLPLLYKVTSLSTA